MEIGSSLRVFEAFIIFHSTWGDTRTPKLGNESIAGGYILITNFYHKLNRNRVAL